MTGAWRVEAVVAPLIAVHPLQEVGEQILLSCYLSCSRFWIKSSFFRSVCVCKCIQMSYLESAVKQIAVLLFLLPGSKVTLLRGRQGMEWDFSKGTVRLFSELNQYVRNGVCSELWQCHGILSCSLWAGLGKAET